MAKTSMIERESKRSRLVAKYAEKRSALKAIIRSPTASDDEKWEAQIKLQVAARCQSGATDPSLPGNWPTARCVP